MIVTWTTLPLVILSIAVGVLGVARLTVVIVYDDFPPAMAVRRVWLRMVGEASLWATLFTCWWCMAFWVALGCIGWWIAAQFVVWAAWAWWIFWGALAAGYLAPMIIQRDGRE